MSEAIVVALLGLAASIVSAVIASTASSRRSMADMMAQFQKQQARLEQEFATERAVTNSKIDDLTRSVERHNDVIERTFIVERDCDNLFHRFAEVRETADEAHATAVHAKERAEAAHNRIDRSGIDRS